MTNESIVTIGGGSGAPIINQALLQTGKVDYINAIAAVYDSGGATGRRRLDAFGQEIAYSDAMRILLSLISGGATPQALSIIEHWFNNRDSRDRVLGHTIVHHLFGQDHGFTQIENDLKGLGFDIKGRVIPSCTQPTNIKFITASRKEYLGEHELDNQRMSQDMVQNMFLDPKASVYPPAHDAIKNASLIILCCGSFYGSVLANFLPRGMQEAIKASKAKIFLVTNLVTTRNETHNFSPGDFLGITKKFIGRVPNGLIVPQMTRQEFENKFPDVAHSYELEYSHFLGWESPELQSFQKENVKIITHDAVNIVKTDNGQKIVRHDPTRLAKALNTILP